MKKRRGREEGIKRVSEEGKHLDGDSLQTVETVGKASIEFRSNVEVFFRWRYAVGLRKLKEGRGER